MNSRVSGAAPGLAGLALILFPLVALAAKLVYPGWMLVLVIWSSWLLLPGYVIQVVIAASALLRRRGVLRHADGGWRAIVASWVTSIGVLGVGFFLLDGGDDGRSESAMTVLSGMTESAPAAQVSMVLALICGFFWLVGWIWLVFEWIIQLILLRRAQTVA
ncbi:hypothetical protein ACIPV2_12490 [Microbacterium sp. NPDC089987]|uniref:hypothetical protein n=1 Tax=Microbacterium sp. NPDC089987 TaxID=3364202 RepID=UPI0037FC5265